MKRKTDIRLFLLALLSVAMLASCGKDKIYDPADDPNKQPATQKTEYVVDKDGYATYEYGGFTYKFKKNVIDQDAAKAAMAKLKEDIDIINDLIPEKALKVMKKRPIWLEEKNMNNSNGEGAAWCHTEAGQGTTFGGLAAKEFCVEITNYTNYVAWSKQNQPLMVLHELCHLYHGQALGGSANTTISNAYNNAKKQNLYTKAKYRYETGGKVYQLNDQAYCMNTVWEYFSEMCEAYWGENDYYPFNYEDLKSHDPVGFAMCESIWGKRSGMQ